MLSCEKNHSLLRSDAKKCDDFDDSIARELKKLAVFKKIAKKHALI